MVIGQRKWPTYKLHADAYVSPLGENVVVTCPACSAEIHLEGHLWPCRGCAGVFVENAPFEGMVAEITHEPWALPPVTQMPGPRACPACNATMMLEQFGSAAIDRGESHGIWFDEAELAAVLADAPPDVSPMGAAPSVGGWVRRLFFHKK